MESFNEINAHIWTIFRGLYFFFISYQMQVNGFNDTVKPVCNDHLYNKIDYLSFIQSCVLMNIEGTNLLVLTISAFWSSSRWPLAT